MNLLMINVGQLDRILRFALGAGLIGWGLYTQNWWGAIGLVPLLTASLSTCPLYTLLGMSTCPIKKA
jgi:hypothetical protein